MNKLSLSPNRARVNSPRATSRNGLALGLALGCAPLVWTPQVRAQNAPVQKVPVAPPAVASAPVAASAMTAPDISVLIVALEDLGAPGAGMAPMFAPPTVPPVGGPLTEAPIAPIDGQPAIVTPTAYRGQSWQWRVLAQKKSKAEKKREREEADRKLFNIDPVATTPYSKPGAKAPNAPVGLGASAPIVRAPGEPFSLSDTPANLAPLSVGAPGRAQLMALPLRRVLLDQGYKDVQVVTPESPTIMRALGEGRLSSRVLDELKRALSTLAANAAAGAPADVSATIAAGRAASRIGQATGYRSVVGLAVGEPTAIEIVGAGAGATTQKVSANMIVADAQRESVEPLQFIETGDNAEIWRETGGAAGARLLNSTLRDWPANSSDYRAALALLHYNTARAAYDRGELPRAQDELNQSLSLDSSRPQTYILRGDILNAIEPGNGYLAYRRAVELNSDNGQDWARIASAYAYSKTPDFPAAWRAGKRALELNYDSAQLRVTIATAQYARAEQYRKFQYPSQSEEAEADARVNLERALQLSPNDPTAVRLLARNLLEKRRFEEAASTLDRIAPRYPDDLEIQTQYAESLVGQRGREEDAFAAYSRVWKLSNKRGVPVDAAVYRTLATGFDQRLFNLGKVAVQLSRGVASRAVLRETALLQLTKLKEEMGEAKDAINVMQPSSAIGATTIQSRAFAADLMDQSLESFQSYLETGQASYFENGDNLYRTAVASLNTARNAQ